MRRRISLAASKHREREEEERYVTVEEKHAVLRLKAAILAQGYVTIMKARTACARRMFDRILTHCIDFAELLEGNERSRRAAIEFNKTALKEKTGLPVVVPEEPEIPLYLLKLQREFMNGLSIDKYQAVQQIFTIASVAPDLCDDEIREAVKALHVQCKVRHRENLHLWREKKAGIDAKLGLMRRIEHARVLVAGSKAANEAAKKNLGCSSRHEVGAVEEKPKSKALPTMNLMVNCVKRVCDEHMERRGHVPVLEKLSAVPPATAGDNNPPASSVDVQDASAGGNATKKTAKKVAKKAGSAKRKS